LKIIPYLVSGGSGGGQDITPLLDDNRKFLKQFLPSNLDIGLLRKTTELEKYIVDDINLNTYGLLPTPDGFISIPRSMDYDSGTMSKIFDYFILDNKIYYLAENTQGEGIVVSDDLQNLGSQVLVRSLSNHISGEKFYYISLGQLKANGIIYVIWHDSNDNLMVGNLFDTSSDRVIIGGFGQIMGVNTYKSWYNTPSSDFYPIHVFGKDRVVLLNADLSNYYSYDLGGIVGYGSMSSCGIISWRSYTSEIIGFSDEERLSFSPSNITGFNDFLSPVFTFNNPFLDYPSVVESDDYVLLNYYGGSNKQIIIDKFGIVNERDLSNMPIKEIRRVRYFNERPFVIAIIESNNTDYAVLMEL